jgi:hypothetical protein
MQRRIAVEPGAKFLQEFIGAHAAETHFQHVGHDHRSAFGFAHQAKRLEQANLAATTAGPLENPCFKQQARQTPYFPCRSDLAAADRDQSIHILRVGD